MELKPLFASRASSTKPSPQLMSNATINLNLLRNNFTIQTWLLLGAAVQALFVLLPIRTVYAVSPCFVFLSWQVIDHLLMTLGLKKNLYMHGVIVGKHTAVYPGPDGSFSRPSGGQGGLGGDEVTVVLLCARSNHPLGILSEGFQKTGVKLDAMNADLKSNAAEYGWLGGTSWLNSGDRTTASEIMLVHYFRNRDGLHAFSHGSAHRKGWDWYNAFSKSDKTLSFTHELYSVPAGRWENIYLNSSPSGFGTTSHLVKDASGESKWVSPIVDASRGKLRSSSGRMGLDDGAGNEKYGAEPYEEAQLPQL